MTHDYEALRASDTTVARLRALHPTLIDLSTTRIDRILEALGRPQDKLPRVIHVAGTNGKGSTLAFLRAIAEAAGLKAHVLTSPHLVRYAERIRVAGQLLTDEAMSGLIDEVEAANAGRPISFFEIGTALALLAFSRTPADVTLIEVGLGGRFDATNVFDAPAVSVIAPVDYDHLEMLGPELGKIAWEKAGVIKAGRPVVVARQSDEALAPIETEAEALGAPMWLMGRDIDAWEERGRLLVQVPDRLLDLPPPGLFGRHQVDNAGLAVAAALRLDHPRLTEEAIGRGVAAAAWPGRFQRLKAGPLGREAAAAGADLWLDGAHNPHGGRALADAIGRLTARDGRPVSLIVGMLARKNAGGFFQALSGSGARIYTVPFSGPTATDPEELQRLALAAGLNARAAQSVEAAVEQILATPPAPHIVICGSLHFVGDILAMSPETWPT
jgi:dihydrofolate synthase/folylpolyglutamate synthase